MLTGQAQGGAMEQCSPESLTAWHREWSGEVAGPLKRSQAVAVHTGLPLLSGDNAPCIRQARGWVLRKDPENEEENGRAKKNPDQDAQRRRWNCGRRSSPPGLERALLPSGCSHPRRQHAWQSAGVKCSLMACVLLLVLAQCGCHQDPYADRPPES